MAINIDTAPSCIQHGVSTGGTVPSCRTRSAFDGFFTFGPWLGVVNPDSPQTSPFWLGASNGTIILAAIGVRRLHCGHDHAWVEGRGRQDLSRAGGLNAYLTKRRRSRCPGEPEL